MRSFLSGMLLWVPAFCLLVIATGCRKEAASDKHLIHQKAEAMGAKTVGDFVFTNGAI